MTWSTVSLQSPSPTDNIWRRAALLLAIAVLHLLFITAIASSSPQEQVARRPTLSVFAVPLSSGQAAVEQTVEAGQPAHATIPDRIPVPSGKLPIAETAAAAGEMHAAPSTSTASVDCGLAIDVGQAIEHDAAAIAELDALPPGTRSPADAVMLWNGQWLDLGSVTTEPMPGPLRGAIEQVIGIAPAECLSQQFVGPQFIPVATGNRTVMVVLGSGTWHWRDLLYLKPSEARSAR